MYRCKKGGLKNIPEDVLDMTAGLLRESGDRETLASFALASSAFYEIASRHQCFRLTIRFGALDAPLSARRLHTIINIKQRGSSVKELIVQALENEVDEVLTDRSTTPSNAWTTPSNAWTTALLAILPRLTGLASFTWSCADNLPLSVMNAIVKHEKVVSLSLALKEDGSNDLLPALNELAKQHGGKLGIQNLSVCTGVPQKESAEGMEALAPLAFRKVLRELIVHSLTMTTLMFRNEHSMDEEDLRLHHCEKFLMPLMTNSHPLKSLSVRGTTGMASYALFGARLSNLTCLELQDIDDCDKLIQAITCGSLGINLKILRVAGLPEPTRDRSQVALANFIRVFQGLEQLELDGVDIYRFTDAIIQHRATLHTLSLVDDRDENDRMVMKRRAVSYSKLAKGCPHLRQLRVNEIPNLVGIADASIGNALQRFNRLETLILMPSRMSSPSTLRPISDVQIYSVARDVMSERLRTLEVIGAYIPTQCSPFDVFRGWSRAELVHPDRKYYWNINCREYTLSPIDMMGQVDQERYLLILRQNQILANCLGRPERFALNGEALQAEAVSRYHDAIQRLLQASHLSLTGLSLFRRPQQHCNDPKSSLITLGYDCRHHNNVTERA